MAKLLKSIRKSLVTAHGGQPPGGAAEAHV